MKSIFSTQEEELNDTLIVNQAVTSITFFLPKLEQMNENNVESLWYVKWPDYSLCLSKTGWTDSETFFEGKSDDET